MSENCLEIRYLVDSLGNVDHEEFGVQAIRRAGYRYELLIYWHDSFRFSKGTSSISLLDNERVLNARGLDESECESLINIVENIKFSFNLGNDDAYDQLPRSSYNISLKRGTSTMNFSWADGDYITLDSSLLTSLTDLVNLIEDLEPLDYEKYGLIRPIKM